MSSAAGGAAGGPEGAEAPGALGTHVLPAITAAAALVAPLVGALYGVVRVGYEEYYRQLGLSPEVIGLGQAAILSRVGVIVGLLFLLGGAFAAFGAAIFRLVGPLNERASKPGPWLTQLAWLLSPFGVLLVAIAGPALLFRGLVNETSLRLWVAGSVGAGMLGLQVSWLVNALGSLTGLPATLLRIAYEAVVKVRWLLLVTVVAGFSAILVANYWNGAARAGESVRRTGRLPITYLHVTVASAQVIPRSGDPVGVCTGGREPVLVGRNGGVSFVLLLPPSRASGPSEVVPLLDSDYTVAATTGDPRPCNPKSP